MAAHTPAQIARHAAVVLAGVASIGLTAISGAYIVNQMADASRHGPERAAPPASPTQDEVIDGGPAETATMLNGGRYEFPALYVRVPAEASATPADVAEPAALATTPAAFGGRLGFGTTYVCAQVAPVHTNTVALTVDTNALTVLTDFLLSEPAREQLGLPGDPAGVTRLRTEVDTRSGEVLLSFSDPTLGTHGLRVDRYPAPTPATTVDESPAPAGAYAITAPAGNRASSTMTAPERAIDV